MHWDIAHLRLVDLSLFEGRILICYKPIKIAINTVEMMVQSTTVRSLPFLDQLPRDLMANSPF